MVVDRPDQLAGLKKANRATTRLLRELIRSAQPGVTTKSLDDLARKRIAELGADPVFFTQAGFPAAINTNPNDVVVHGVPGAYVLRNGDILTIDCGMILDGYAGDAAATFAVGQSSPRHERLITATRGAMNNAIRAAKTGRKVGDVSWAMQSHAESQGFRVVEGFVGHGLGRKMWEDPVVPFAGKPNDGPDLVEGMVITIEPVVAEGSPEWDMDDDGWTARTRDGGWVAQFERAVMVTKRGGVVLSGD